MNRIEVSKPCKIPRFVHLKAAQARRRVPRLDEAVVRVRCPLAGVPARAFKTKFDFGRLT